MKRQGEGEVKKQLYEQFAQIGKALGSARRLELIDLLAQAEFSVEKLAQETEMSVANTSQHLQTLRAARLVEVRREGIVANYRLANPAVFEAWFALRRVGETSMAEVDRLVKCLFPAREPGELVGFAELARLMEEGDVLIVDVRPEEEYHYGHICGACSIPLVSLPGRLGELDPEKPIVIYGRGPYSTLADEAVRLLQAEGFDAVRLEMGLPEWRFLDYPVDVTYPELVETS